MPQTTESSSPHPFSKEFVVGWGDLDANGHMRNTAYLEFAATARLCYLALHGFSVQRFRKEGFNAIVLKDEIDYSREIHLLQAFSVNFLQDGMNENGSVYRIVNEFYNARNILIARVITHGAWFDLKSRKIIVPPAELLAIMQALPKTATYAAIIGRES